MTYSISTIMRVATMVMSNKKYKILCESLYDNSIQWANVVDGTICWLWCWMSLVRCLPYWFSDRIRIVCDPKSGKETPTPSLDNEGDCFKIRNDNGKIWVSIESRNLTVNIHYATLFAVIGILLWAKLLMNVRSAKGSGYFLTMLSFIGFSLIISFSFYATL